MKKLTLFYQASMVVCLMSTAAACTDEVPPVPADELYLRGFVKQFGVPAQDHTFSMAEPVMAEIDINVAMDGTATFYTDAPNAPGSFILGRTDVSRGRGSMKFDIADGSDRVYVRVERNDGSVEYSGYAYVNDGKLSVGTGGSRASESCPVTAAPLDYKVGRVKERNLKAVLPYVGDKTTTWERLLEILGHDNLDPVDQKEEVSVPRLYYLKDYDYSIKTPEFSNLDIIPIVYSYINTDGSEERGIFNNQSDFDTESGGVKEDNVTKYFFKNQILDPDVTMSVRDEGEVTMDLMWRTMEGDTYWGYYYYSPEEEAEFYADPLKFFNEVPKYVVFRSNQKDSEHSLSGNNSILEIKHCTNWSSHPDSKNPDMNHEGDHVMSDWENLESNTAKTISTQIKYFRPCVLRSTRARLVYFGPQGNNTQGSYIFPKGTRIGFFYGRVNDQNKFYFGNASMNYYLFHYHIYPMGEFKATETPDNYSIFAAKYRYDGSNYVGFEEGGGDNDLNDIVFRIHNTWPPETDLTPDDLPSAQPKEWIIACEDLGNTEDYDFNDIVLKVSHVSGENLVAITPLACGGVLDSYVYFGGDQTDNLLGEIHDMLGVAREQMAGVGNGHPDIDMSKVPTLSRTVDAAWLMSENFGDFHIFTQQPGERDITKGVWIEKETSQEGSEFRAPQILLLPDDWRWPLERLNITNTYPDFKGWIGKPADHHDWTTVGSHNHHLLYERRD